jgi:adenylate cyclase
MRYRFEDYVLDTDRRELRRGGESVPIAPQVFDLLVHLVRYRDRVVTKEALVAAVWDGRLITDAALTTRLNVVRSAIGDNGREQRLIKTMPRKGFRFVAPVCEEPAVDNPLSTKPLPEAAEPSFPLPEQPSIAVLPFANLSGDPLQDFFGDAIAEEVLTELARLSWLLVIARNSTFAFKGRELDVKQVGHDLGVRYVLLGSVRRFGDRVRIGARLVETTTGVQVWAERFDRKLADVFDVQDDITRAVVTAIAPAIVEAERRRIMRKMPETLVAWEAYQRGVWHMLKQDAEHNQLARGFFQRSVDIDAEYSSGYDGLAWTHLMESSTFSRISIAEGCERSEPLARKAVALDTENAEARARLALTIYLMGDSKAAIAEAEQALRISPNCADAFGVRGAALVFSGQRKEGRASLEHYLRLSPRDPARPIRMAQIAASYYFERDYARAAEMARRAVREFPTVPIAYRWLAAALGQLGRAAEGQEVMQGLRRTSPSSIDMYVKQLPPQYRRVDYNHMMAGLLKAGWDTKDIGA